MFCCAVLSANAAIEPKTDRCQMAKSLEGFSNLATAF